MPIPFLNPKKPKNVIKTVQQYQQEFNQLMYELGSLHYQKYMVAQQGKQLDSAINTKHQLADTVGKDAHKAQEKVKADLAAAIKKDQEAAKAEVADAPKAD